MALLGAKFFLQRFFLFNFRVLNGFMTIGGAKNLFFFSFLQASNQPFDAYHRFLPNSF